MDIHDEITIPGQEARYGDAPAWRADSPVWPAVKAQTGGGQLYLHQAMGLKHSLAGVTRDGRRTAHRSLTASASRYYGDYIPVPMSMTSLALSTH